MASDATMPPPRSLTAIVAATTSNGIGKNGTLPWRLPGEMKYFARVTTGENASPPNAVIMGRKTWESIPTKFRPLKARQNIVVSRQHLSLDEDMTTTAKSLESALDKAKDASRAFLIGGAQLYNLALAPSAAHASESSATSHASAASPKLPLADRILLTRITSPEYDCDTFLAGFATLQQDGEPIWALSTHADLCKWLGWDAPEGEVEEKGVKYRYEMWIRR